VPKDIRFPAPDPDTFLIGIALGFGALADAGPWNAWSLGTTLSASGQGNVREEMRKAFREHVTPSNRSPESTSRIIG